ncbi:hypothetical protein Tco_0365962 [Tanacetum coccineum]
MRHPIPRERILSVKVLTTGLNVSSQSMPFEVRDLSRSHWKETLWMRESGNMEVEFGGLAHNSNFKSVTIECCELDGVVCGVALEGLFVWCCERVGMDNESEVNGGVSILSLRIGTRGVEFGVMESKGRQFSSNVK